MSSPLPETQKVIYPAINASSKHYFEEIPLPKPSENQVIIKVEYAPIHPSDLTFLRGFYRIPGQPPEPCGSEGSGIIVAIGTNLKVPRKIGERVFIFGAGSYNQYVTRDSEDVQEIPENLSLEEAASHFLNPSTVYYMGTLAEGHKAAIHTVGASALGRMLIKYFKYKGIKLINIVRKDEQIEELKAEGADYVLNSQAVDFEAQLKEVAEKENATVAFDAISGDFTNKIVRAQPPKSVVYVYGGLDGYKAHNVEILELFKGKIVTGFLIYNHYEELKKKGELIKFFNDVHELLPTVFYSKVQKSFLMSQLDEALAYYKENSSKGKVLLRPNY